MAVFFKRLWFVVFCLCLAGAAVYCFRAQLLYFLSAAYEILADREKSQAFLAGLGWRAPFVYMIFQTLQVIIAPVPGEVTGFIGGYLFGTFGGFVFSTVALTLGSWINFLIGRMLGKRWIRRLIPGHTLSRMDYLLKHQGAVVVFILFLFPGFPKDGLCFFLGLSSLPLKVLILLAFIGRMPGTLLLSAQGASLFEKDYILLAVLVAVCVLMAFIAWWYREPFYRWIEKQNHHEL